MTPHSQSVNVKNDVFTIVNNRIIEQLEKGYVPWRQPWTGTGLPRNLITGRSYRGFNVLLLASLGFPLNIFLTLKQVNDLGGMVRKGEHSCPVVFWSQTEKINETTGEKEVKRVLRYYMVFNIDQCTDLPEDKIPEYKPKIDPIASCEDIVAGMPKKPVIEHKSQKAFYNPSTDIVNMPRMKTFTDSASYYMALFHELIHATGHESRLNRETLVQTTRRDSEPYAEEELVAQIGACFLAAHAGCTFNFENDVAYIQGWLAKLKNEKRFLLFASAKAQRAIDYILNLGDTEFAGSSNSADYEKE